MRFAATIGDRGDIGCEGDISKEVCCAAGNATGLKCCWAKARARRTGLPPMPASGPRRSTAASAIIETSAQKPVKIGRNPPMIAHRAIIESGRLEEPPLQPVFVIQSGLRDLQGMDDA